MPMMQVPIIISILPIKNAQRSSLITDFHKTTKQLNPQILLTFKSHVVP